MSKHNKTTCTRPGCAEPRRRTANGKTMPLCDLHQREVWNATRKREKAKATPTAPSANTRSGRYMVTCGEEIVLMGLVGATTQREGVIAALRSAGYGVSEITEVTHG